MYRERFDEKTGACAAWGRCVTSGRAEWLATASLLGCSAAGSWLMQQYSSPCELADAEYQERMLLAHLPHMEQQQQCQQQSVAAASASAAATGADAAAAATTAAAAAATVGAGAGAGCTGGVTSTTSTTTTTATTTTTNTLHISRPADVHQAIRHRRAMLPRRRPAATTGAFNALRTLTVRNVSRGDGPWEPSAALGDQLLAAAALGCPQLRTLELSGVLRVGGPGLLLLRRLRHLSRLQLEQWTNTVDELAAQQLPLPVSCLPTGLTSLVLINVRPCSEPSPADVVEAAVPLLIPTLLFPRTTKWMSRTYEGLLAT